MFHWYKNSKVGIDFDLIPQVGIRYYIPSMTVEEQKSIERYPFINKRELEVKLEDFVKNISYEFSIPKGYCYDGASIPKIFWNITGSNTDNRFLIPALIHDVLCENHSYINNDREFSTNVFNALLEANKVNKFQRFCMKHSVNCFQKFKSSWRGNG